MSADDPEELEEERRLCYVGITRAEKELTLSSARRRMVRGETHYHMPSRFLQEIPETLIDSGKTLFPLQEKKDEAPHRGVYRQAKEAFRQQPFQTNTSYRPVKQFTVNKEKGLDYKTGDRVRHVKFGVGTVQAITEGGRDYEVTVDFDTAGTKKMFAAFAKLVKEE